VTLCSIRTWARQQCKGYYQYWHLNVCQVTTIFSLALFNWFTRE